jgi:glycosyltransferase involved in cell wall biosynthesis
LRVGLFTESYDPVINGVSTSVKTLAAELLVAGHEPTIIAPVFPGYKDDADNGIPVRRLPSWRTVFNPGNPFAYPPVGLPPAALRDLSVDVVHTQQPFGIGMHGRQCARRFGVPLVSTFHTLYTLYSHYFPVVPEKVAVAFVARQLWRYYQTCDAIIVPSREAGRRLESIGVTPSALYVVPTGVPEAPNVLPAAIERARQGFSLPAGAPVLLFVGRLAREKNMDLLVNAFAALCPAFPDDDQHPILLLVGSGPYVSACRQRVERAGIEKWVRFAGFLGRNQLAPVYAAATLFAFPSSTETQGVVLSEAQSFGVPCVLVQGGGAPEFVRDGVDALVTRPTVEAFRAALWELLTNDERRRAMSAAALASPLRPPPADMAHRVVEVYANARGAGARRSESRFR